MKRIAVLLLTSLTMIAGCIFTGCAYLRSETLDPVIVNSGTNGVRPQVAFKKTIVRTYTLFDAHSELTKVRATTGQAGNGSNVWSYPAGVSIGSVSQEATSSNLVTITGNAAAIGSMIALPK